MDYESINADVTAKDLLGSDGKFKVRRHTERMPFLPFVQNFASVIGGPQSPRGLIRMVEKQTGRPSSISNSSLDNIWKSGVGKSVAAKYLSYFASFQKDLFSRLLKIIPKRPTSIYETHVEWRAVLAGFKISNSNHSEHFQVVIDFLEERCEQAESAYLKGKKLRDEGIDTVDAGLNVFDELNKHMYLVESDMVKDMLVQRVNDDSSEIGSEYHMALISMDLDFYLNLTAHYETYMILELLDGISDLRRVRPDLLQDGVLTQVINMFDGSKSGCGGYFNFYLDFIKSFAPNGEYSDYNLAKSIPVINGYDNSSYTNHEKQLNQLKDWRKGKNTPSYDRLNEFMIDLCNQDNCFSDCLTRWGYVCLVMDRYVAEIGKEINIKVISSCISRYATYWEISRNKFLLE